MVSLDEFGRHRHRVSDVGKAFATDAVDGELASLRRSHVNAGEIADRVVVFRVVQSTQRYRPRISSPRCRLCIKRRRDPAQQLFPLSLGRLWRFLRRHVATAHPISDIAEHFRPSNHRLSGVKAREIEIVFRGLLSMTLPASLHEKWLDLLLEDLAALFIRRHQRRREETQRSEEQSRRVGRSFQAVSTTGTKRYDGLPVRRKSRRTGSPSYKDVRTAR